MYYAFEGRFLHLVTGKHLCTSISQRSFWVASQLAILAQFSEALAPFDYSFWILVEGDAALVQDASESRGKGTLV